MTTHYLKIWRAQFNAQKSRRKNFEYRDGKDRTYKCGDTLCLQEWIPDSPESKTGKYTGRELWRLVSYVMASGFGLPKGKVILSTMPGFKPSTESEPNIPTLVDNSRLGGA